MGAQMSNEWGDVGELSGDDADDLYLPTKDAVENTVICFDWDDTLLCTSAISNNTASPEELEEVERVVESVLRTAMSLGETLIVTNGRAGWVQESARRWLPGLVPILQEIESVSARGLYQDDFPGDPFMWKWATFEQLLTVERSFPAKLGLNLVSVGDQMPEHHAAHHAVQLVGGRSQVKTVKFAEQPSVAELVGQLCKIERALASIVASGGSQDWQLRRRRQRLSDCSPQSVLDPSRASAWQCSLPKSDKALSRGCADTHSIRTFWNLLS